MTDSNNDWFERQRLTAVKEPWWVWLSAAKHSYGLISLFGRIEISGSIDAKLLRGPLLLAPNHIGNFDAFVLTVVMRRVGLSPRFLITAGIMNAPVAGRLLEKSGNLQVNRGKAEAHKSTELVDLALQNGAHLCIYPEGRVGLDPGLWPELGKTGLARLALAHRVPVIPVSQWGAHEVTKYEQNNAMFGSTVSSIWRQPKLQIHFGKPVMLDDLQHDHRGDAVKARNRIAAAITRGLIPLRANEMTAPKYVDGTRPVNDRPGAAFPGGQVPSELP